MNIAKDILINQIKTKKVAHAYLFLGLDREFIHQEALEFAKVLNCTKPTKNLGSCGECISCKKIQNFNHPDIEHVRLCDNTRQIKIDQIRLVQKKAYLKSIEAKKKVYIIYDADSMTHASANSLLKILEEPPVDVVFILISSHLGTILPTIISRCQIIKFSQAKASSSHTDNAMFMDEFINTQDAFAAGELKFIKRSKIEQLRTVDCLLECFRDSLIKLLVDNKMIVEENSPEDILRIMQDLLKAKDLLISNVNSKLVADYILGSIHKAAIRS